MAYQLSNDEISKLVGFLETIKDEAEEMPQVGGNEATIIEQADAALDLLTIECPACSRADGGSGRGIRHLAPVCSDDFMPVPAPSPESEADDE